MQVSFIGVHPEPGLVLPLPQQRALRSGTWSHHRMCGFYSVYCVRCFYTLMAAKKLYIIAGEASGDLHGSNVMKELFRSEPDMDIRFWGGDKMEAVGGTMAMHIRKLAYMCFVEVLMNIRTILRNIHFCKEDIEAFQPDALLLIDYPGFNMRIAEWAKKRGIKVYFYISPTVWAWKEKRVEKIRRDVFQLFVILPFEKPFYAKHNYEVEYVGHPLLDAIEQYNEQPVEPLSIPDDPRPIIAVLPGSRGMELKKKLPVMLTLVDAFPAYRFVIAGAPQYVERNLRSTHRETQSFGGFRSNLRIAATVGSGCGDFRNCHAGNRAFWHPSGRVLYGESDFFLDRQAFGKCEIHLAH